MRAMRGKSFFKLLLILFFVVAYKQYTVFAIENVNVFLDGSLLAFDVPAQIIDGRTMVPVRKIFEELGMSVTWDEANETVEAFKPGVFIALPINSYTIYRNSVEENVDVPAQIINDRTLVPVRVVAEYAGADVSWDDTLQTVNITSQNVIQYLNWNDNYCYYGEVENGKACGYGMLFRKGKDEVSQMGKYVDSEIITGTDYFENGAMYVGNYENGSYSYGTYYYTNGDSYTGEFVDSQKNGEGVYNYSNGNFYDGFWRNDLPNGRGTFYDIVESVQYWGEYVDGKKVGSFKVTDYYTGETYYVNYADDLEIEEYYRKEKELNNEYTDLETWYLNEKERLYDYIQNGDPFSTEWAKSIYESYGIVNGISPADSNLDSFAAANAARQQATIKAKADSEILSYNSTYISNQKQLLDDTYKAKKSALDSKKESLESEKMRLGL